MFIFKVRCWNDVEGVYSNSGVVTGSTYDSVAKKLQEYYMNELISMELMECEDIVLKEDLLEDFELCENHTQERN